MVIAGEVVGGIVEMDWARASSGDKMFRFNPHSDVPAASGCIAIPRGSGEFSTGIQSLRAALYRRAPPTRTPAKAPSVSAAGCQLHAGSRPDPPESSYRG